MICGGLVAMFVTVIIVQASLQHTNQTIVAFMHKIMGKWVTRIILVPYFFLGIVSVGLNLKEFMAFVQMALFNSTPQWVPIFVFFLVIVYLTHQGGIEGIARCAQIIGPCLIITICAVFLLNINFLDVHQLLPIYHDSGWRNIFNGSFISAGFFGQTFVLFMLVPFLNRPEQAKGSTLWALGTVIVLTTLSISSEILLFGANLASRMLNPIFEFARFISYMEFIENVDSVVVVVWIMGYFIAFSMYLFIISYGVGEWLGLKNWRKGLWVTSILIVVVSIFPTKMDITSALMRYVGLFVLLIMIHMFVVPGALWGIGRLHQFKGGKRVSRNKS